MTKVAPMQLQLDTRLVLETRLLIAVLQYNCSDNSNYDNYQMIRNVSFFTFIFFLLISFFCIRFQCFHFTLCLMCICHISH